MKKMLLAGLLVFSSVLLSAAEESFQVGFWFGVPAETVRSDVEGIKLGIPVSSGEGKVAGAELSILCSATKHLTGFQWAWFGLTSTNDLKGVQLSFLNLSNRLSEGLQLGILNHSAKRGFQWGLINHRSNNARFQLGLINVNKDGWLPIMIFVNFGKGTFEG